MIQGEVKRSMTETKIHRKIRLPISLKITFPYAALALLFSLIAAYIVTTLVFENIERRFRNNLLAAGRITADLMVSKENELLAVLRTLAHTDGVAESLTSGDAEALRILAYPVVTNQGIEAVDFLDAQGRNVLSLHHQASGDVGAYASSRDAEVYTGWDFVMRTLREDVDVNNGKPSDKYAGWVTAPWGKLFYTSGPVYDAEGTFSGVILVGQTLPTLASDFQREVGVDILTFYDTTGVPIVSTYTLLEEQGQLPTKTIQAVRAGRDAFTMIRPVTVGSVDFSEVLGVWQSRNGEEQGIAGVARATDVPIAAGRTSRLMIFGTITLLFLLVIGVGVLVARLITRPLKRVVAGIEEVDRGNFDVDLVAEGNDEIAVLAESFNAMVGGLRDKVRMEGELKFARQIQMSLLPNALPGPHSGDGHPPITMAATLVPAREVGGDFYDYYYVDDDYLCFVIGDVSGKGAAAALFMAMGKILIKSRIKTQSSPAKVLTYVNEELSRDNKQFMFITIFIGVVNVKTGELVHTNAGHNPPYLLRSAGEVVCLEERHGPVVGPMKGTTYQEGKLELAPDDTLLLFTDGVTEAMDASETLFSEERLVDLLSAQGHRSPEALTETTLDAVRAFMGDAEQADDITILTFQYRGLQKRVSASPQTETP
jgi:serine phosphatase RsbU (regulator of sigma subunit)